MATTLKSQKFCCVMPGWQLKVTNLLLSCYGLWDGLQGWGWEVYEADQIQHSGHTNMLKNHHNMHTE